MKAYKNITVTILVGIFTFLLLNNTEILGQTYVSGNQYGTWTLANSPYIVNGYVTVPDGQTLSIEPGVQVKFDGNYSIEVYGTLIADGTASNHIVFTSNNPTLAPGNWHKIRFSSGDAGSILNYCDFSYGGSQVDYAMLDISYTNNLTISNCTVSYSADHGIRLENSSFPVTACTIHHNARHGLYLTGASSPTLTNCDFLNNGGFGILSDDGNQHPVITGGRVTDNSSNAVRISGYAATRMNGVTITGNALNEIQVNGDDVPTGTWG